MSSHFSKLDPGRRLADDEEEEEEDESSDDEIEPKRNARRPTPIPRRGGDAEGGAGASGGARGGGGGGNVAKLPIQIRTMDGKTYKIDAKTDWDVQRLKQEFERWHGGNAAMCSLYYKAKKLQDNNTLQSYKIGAGDFIMANYRSVGGRKIGYA